MRIRLKTLLLIVSPLLLLVAAAYVQWGTGYAEDHEYFGELANI